MSISRPTTRAGCQVEGSCHFVSCRYNLAIDVSTRGTLLSRAQTAFPVRRHRRSFEAWSDQVVESMAEADFSCALDVADRGAHTLTQISKIIGVTRERVRQIEDKALDKLAVLGRELREAHQETADALSRSGAGIGE